MKKNNDADDDDGAKSHIEIERFPFFPVSTQKNAQHGVVFTLFVNFKHFIAKTRAFKHLIELTMSTDS